jgi:hypothetical protein
MRSTQAILYPRGAAQKQTFKNRRSVPISLQKYFERLVAKNCFEIRRERATTIQKNRRSDSIVTIFYFTEPSLATFATKSAISGCEHHSMPTGGRRCGQYECCNVPFTMPARIASADAEFCQAQLRLHAHSGRPALRSPSTNLAKSSVLRSGIVSLSLEMRSSESSWRIRAIALRASSSRPASA